MIDQVSSHIYLVRGLDGDIFTYNRYRLLLPVHIKWEQWDKYEEWEYIYLFI